MLQEIWQEIIRLGQDKQFVRNLTIVAITVIASSLSLAEEYRHPARLAQKEKLAQFSNLVFTGIEIKRASEK